VTSRPKSLDHVALWVVDRDRIADFATAHLGMHVIERTDDFTLIGSDARRGKLTLFAAAEPRETGPLQHVALRVADLARAESTLPEALQVDRSRAGELYFNLFEGLRLGLVEAPTPVEYDLDHVALRSPDPEASAQAWHRLGFDPAEPRDDAVRVGVAGAYLELREGPVSKVELERPLLNHLALLVDSADALRERAEQAGAEVADVVDAENTYAVFVYGPERVKLEYVEHKPSFSLA
jgi:catechol 2,3-dioxygenase-like lactoylglutathione lyase family enzyme